jgi:hypothetical protein
MATFSGGAAASSGSSAVNNAEPMDMEDSGVDAEISCKAPRGQVGVAKFDAIASQTWSDLQFSGSDATALASMFEEAGMSTFSGDTSRADLASFCLEELEGRQDFYTRFCLHHSYAGHWKRVKTLFEGW